MKRLIFILLFICSLGFDVNGQTPTCTISATFTNTGAFQSYDNRTNHCNSWTITYDSQGFSNVQIDVYGTLDNNGSMGANTLLATYTSKTLNNTQLSGYYPWYFIFATNLTGSGKINYKMYGSVITATNQGPSAGAVITPAQFGAVGNDIADDTASFQAALDFAGLTQNNITVTPGTYKVSSTLHVPTGVSIKCRGDATSIHYIGASIAIDSKSKAATHILNIDSCHITTSTGTTAIDMQGVWLSEITNNWIEGFSTTGIDVNGNTYGAYFNNIIGNRVTNSPSAIRLHGDPAGQQANSNQVADNRLYGATYGIIIEAGAESNNINRNDIEGFALGTSYGIYDVSNNNHIQNNWTESIAGNGDAFTGIYEHGLGYATTDNKFGFSTTGTGTVTYLDYVTGVVGSLRENNLQLHDMTVSSGLSSFIRGGAWSSNIGTLTGSLRGNSLQEEATNGASEISINKAGYNNGASQFRNTAIYDGKGERIGYFEGSTKKLLIDGGFVNLVDTTSGVAKDGNNDVALYNGSSGRGLYLLCPSAGATGTAPNTVEIRDASGTVKFSVACTGAGALTLTNSGILTFDGVATFTGLTLNGGTGGVSKFLRQNTLNGAIDVVQPSCSTLSDAAATCNSASGASLTNSTIAPTKSTNYNAAGIGKAVCWKDANNWGYCSTVVGATGGCTCN